MMKKTPILIAIMLLTGCAGSTLPPQKVNDEIMAEMDRAAQKRQSAQPEAVNQALLPPLRMELPNAPRRPLEPKFDLVVNSAPAREVFMSIVSGTRYSMIVHPEVSGVISVNLKDVTVREALDSIREVYGYEYKLDGARVYIQPAGLQTRVFQVNYLIGLRAGRSDVRVSSGAISGNYTGTGQAPQATANLVAGAPVGGAVGTPGQPMGGTNLNATGASALSGTTNDATRISTVSQNDFWLEVSTALRTLVGDGAGRNVVVSPQSGVIVVRALPQEIRSVESYLKAMRISVERQVMIEAKVVDITLNDAYQSGINWAAFPTNGISTGPSNPGTLLQSSGPLATGATGIAGGPGNFTISGSAIGSNAGQNLINFTGAAGVFGLAFQTRNFAALLTFLESQGTTQVLSSPRVATLNNQKAVLKVGTDQFFVTGVTSTTVAVSATQTGVSLTPTLASFFSGVSLDITPQIDEEGNIFLHVHPLVSKVDTSALSFNFGAGVGQQDLQTAQSTISETDTIVRVQDGNIVALGGLMKLDVENSRAGIPGAQNLPGVGGLFGNRSTSRVKKELVILLKPTVIKSDKDWEQDLQQTRDRMQSYGQGADGSQASGTK